MSDARIQSNTKDQIPDISAEHKQEIIEAYKAWGIYGWDD